MVEKKTKRKRKDEPTCDNVEECTKICMSPFQHFYDDFPDTFNASEYQKAENKFHFLAEYFRWFQSCSVDYFEGSTVDSDDMVPVPKWAFKAVAEAFWRHHKLVEVEHNLDSTLDDAFGVIKQGKQESIKKLYARNKEEYFRWLNRIRMHFGLNIKDAATATWKVIVFLKEVRPGSFYNFNASPESMLDSYYREFPQQVFIQWVVRESQSTQIRFCDDRYWMEFIERIAPDAATFIKRKMKLKVSSSVVGKKHNPRLTPPKK